MQHNVDRLKVPAPLGGPTANDLRDRLEAQAAKKEEEKEAGEEDKSLAAKRNREYTFQFNYTSGDQVYAGLFKNRILNVNERMRAGALTSDLLMGRPMDSIPGTSRDLAIAVAWMTLSLDAKRPPWAADLSTIDDEVLVMKLYGEVWDHQATFLGRADNAKPASAT